MNVTPRSITRAGHWRRIGWAGAATEAMREGARMALAAVSLDGFERGPIETLSAGQFQRVLFARLIVQDAELILLDEPFASVDWRTSEDLLLWVESRHREAGRSPPCFTTSIRSGRISPTHMRRLGSDARGRDARQPVACATCPKPGRLRRRTAGGSLPNLGDQVGGPPRKAR
jgi:ABC-type histidine transport system ATPase subunit